MDLPWQRYTFSGSAKQVGLQMGECFQSSLKELIQLRYEAMAEYMELTTSSLKITFEQKTAAHERYLKSCDPLAHEEMVHVCQGAQVSVLDYLLTANMTDYRDHGDKEGCTSMVGRLSTGELYGAQTWDLGQENMKHVVLVDRAIAGRPRVIALSCAGYPPLAGMNEHGLGLGTTNIKTSEVGDGLGYQSLLQLGLWQKNVSSAKKAFKHHERCGSHTYWIVDDVKACQLDTSHRQCLCEIHENQALVRVNHPIPYSLKIHQLEEPSETSLTRLHRAKALLVCDHSVEDLMRIMGHRGDGIHSISRHTEDGTGITTNGCVIVIPQHRKIWACRGPSDTGDWSSFEFDQQ